jgi:hypothetical protein
MTNGPPVTPNQCKQFAALWGLMLWHRSTAVFEPPLTLRHRQEAEDIVNCNGAWENPNAPQGES